MARMFFRLTRPFFAKRGILGHFGPKTGAFRAVMALKFLRTASKQFYIVDIIHIYPITYGSYVFPPYPSVFCQKGYFGAFWA